MPVTWRSHKGRNWTSAALAVPCQTNVEKEQALCLGHTE